MTFHQRPLSEPLSASLSMSPQRGRGSRRRVIQGVWIVFALGLLVLFLVNIPAFFQYARTVCTLPDAGDCPTEQFTPAYIQALDRRHLSISMAEGFLAALIVAVSVFYWLLGLLIFWRKSQERIGLLVSLLLVLVGSIGLLGFNLPVQTPPLPQLLANVISLWVMWPAMLVFFFTFPTGRFAPRWAWAAFVPFFVVTMLSSFPATAPFVPVAAAILTSLLPIVIQIYRYVWLYNAVQRQQTKWFVFGLSIVFLLVILQSIFQAAAPDSPTALSWYQLFNGPFWLLLWTILLLSVSIPVLRYRLWDIDVIISLTLVYSSLTTLLVAFYIGLILVLQAVVHRVTGSVSQQPLVIVASTLVIAALFRPLRQRLQTFIDRRFYRRKYDATRTIAAFSATLHNEVNQEQVHERLLAVVQETMQPSQISLWISQPRRTSLPWAGTFPSEEARAREKITEQNV